MYDDEIGIVGWVIIIIFSLLAIGYFVALMWNIAKFFLILGTS